LLEKKHDLDDDRRDAGAREQRSHGAHRERECQRPAPRAGPEAASEAREVDHQDVEHREGEDDEQDGDAEVEPRRRVDGAEGAGGEDHHQAD
jgi:hypothetical protein